MAQDYDKYELDNNSGQGFRLALNKVLEAAVTQNSGPDSPNTSETSYPYQVWVDTDALPAAAGAVVKIRDAATATSWYSLYKTDANGQPTGAVATGSYSISTNDTAGTGGTTAITVDTSQRVGIGTASPAEKLEVKDTVNDVTLQISATGTSKYANLYLAGTAAENYLTSNQDLSFYILASEKARIDSSGRLGIGTTSPTRELHINGQINVSDGSSDRGLIYWNSTTGLNLNNKDNTSLTFSTSDTERLQISSAGELYSVPTYNNSAAISANMFVTAAGNFGRSTSSAKYKTNIETIEDSYSDALLECRPVWYRSTSKLDNPDYGWWGFIAEEVAEIDPRLVFWKTVDITYDEKGSVVETPCEPEPEGVAYDRFVPHLLNLIKRQQQAIETLEAKVAALESA